MQVFNMTKAEEIRDQIQWEYSEAKFSVIMSVSRLGIRYELYNAEGDLVGRARVGKFALKHTDTSILFTEVLEDLQDSGIY